MRKLPSYRRTVNGCARVSINGRDFSLGKFGTKTSRQQYDQIIAEYLASGRSKAFGKEQADITVSELMVEYLKHCRDWYPTGPNSETERIRVVMRDLKSLYASTPISDFGPRQLEAVRQRLLEKDRELSRSYINSQIGRLKRMFHWAATRDYMTWESFYRLKELPGLQRGRTSALETEAVRPVCEKLVAATLLNCSSTIADMVRVQLLTGMRPQEVCDLTPSMIQRKPECWVATLPNHKTAWRGKVREVLIGPEAQAIIAPYLLREANAYLFSPSESEAKRKQLLSEKRITPLNSGNKPGSSKRVREGRKAKRQPKTAYNARSYYRSIQYACKKGSLEAWAPNQLRHLAATKIRAEFGLDVAAILGHSSVTVTQVYAENDQRKAAEAIRKIG